MRLSTLAVLLIGCSDAPLEDGFEESFTRGYSCRAAFVVLTNRAETVRLSASFYDLDGQVPEDARLRVSTGARLVLDDRDPCDDQIERQWGTAWPHIDCTYLQASGTASADIGDDTIAVVTEGVTLAVAPDAPASCADHPDVVMSDGALMAVPLEIMVAL